MPRLPNGDVIAFYSNPKSGKTERYLMSSVSYDEAINPRQIRIVHEGPERVEVVASGEEGKWSLDPPEKGGEIEDHVHGIDYTLMPGSQPPPALPTRPVDPLNRGPKAASPVGAPPPKR